MSHFTKISRLRAYSLLAATPVAFGLVLQLKQYAIWDQVVYYWSSGYRPVDLLADVSSHALRYTLLYPVFWIGQQLELHYDVIFSGLVVLLLVGTLQAMDHSARLCTQKTAFSLPRFLVSAVPLVLLFLVMNGRGALTFFGFSILLEAIFKAHFLRRITFAMGVQIFVGIVFCAASSGTLVTAIFALASAGWLEILRAIPQTLFARISRVGAAFLATGVVLLVALGSFVLSGIEKNILFYGGGFEGVLKMLNHGAGASIYPYVKNLTLPQVVTIAVVVAFAVEFVLLRLRNVLLWHILLCSLAAGAFGFSTLALAVLPMMLLAQALWHQRRVWLRPYDLAKDLVT